MSSDKFSLKSEEFFNNAASFFQRLLKDTDFTDVTLASSDGQLVRAHKVVLSSVEVDAGPEPPWQRPVVHEGMKLTQLETLMTFCYLGQAEVLHSNLEEFLEVTKDLGIRGLGQKDTQHRIKNRMRIAVRSKVHLKKQIRML